MRRTYLGETFEDGHLERRDFGNSFDNEVDLGERVHRGIRRKE